MNNEIKQGDKVKVSKDAPRIYTPDWTAAMFDLVLKVTAVEDDNAMVEFEKRTPYRTVLTTIPTKYLVKVDAEAKETKPKPKYKIGDRMFIAYINKIGVIDIVEGYNEEEDGVYYHLKVEPKGAASAREENLTPYTEPTENKIKVGDWVRNVKSDLCGIALNIEHGIVEVGIPYDKEKHYWNTDIVELFEPTEQAEAEKPNHTIKIPVEVDLTESFWNTYTADLAKEVALKVANEFNDPEQAAEYAVSVAKAVVEGLKRE